MGHIWLHFPKPRMAVIASPYTSDSFGGLLVMLMHDDPDLTLICAL